jgi:hypothetical protein
MENHPGRFPDDMRQHLVDAFADYLDAFKAAAQSDGSDLTAHLHQLMEAIAGVNRAMHAGTFLTQFIERVLGPEPEPPTDRSDPIAEAQYQDDLARWVMQAWQIVCQVFLLPATGAHPIIDALHNDMERGVAGNPLQFFRPVRPQHGNKRDVLQHTAGDAFVYAVILAEAELDGIDRIQRVLDSAGVGITTHGFTGMRRNVADKAALDRVVAEAKRRRGNRLGRTSALRGMALITGSLSVPELVAIFPERHADLASLGSVEARIRYLFSRWSKGS